MKKSFIIAVIAIFTVLVCSFAMAAYHHQGESDSDNFIAVYPEMAGTKLDHCALCHKGGEYEKKPGKWVSLGSCQWCHHIYGYDGQGDLDATMNEYGKAYDTNGQNQAAVRAIENLDSDADGFDNITEINATRYPGNPDDDPDKAPAPYRIYTLKQIEDMDKHTQFMLMNTHRSGDYYARFSGVILEDLLNDAGVLTNAASITVYAPDGWSNDHPIAQSRKNDGEYPVKGVYPEATFQYHEEADTALNQVDGWCDYSSVNCRGRNHGDPIAVSGGLRTILATKIDGAHLDPGVLNTDNKLDGSGPFRVVPPQLVPCAPDQSCKAENQDVVWPFVDEWDHNAGSATRSTTIIKVEPLPEGTTDIDVLEAGWDYVDKKKIIIYGAINGTDSNGNGILDSEEGDNDPDPKKARCRPVTCSGKMEIRAPKGLLRNVRAMSCDDPGLSQVNRPNMDFPYGAIKCEIHGLDPLDPDGEKVTLTFEFPGNVPKTAKFYKVTAAGWVELPFEDNDGDPIIEVTFQDGDPLTDADGVKNGTIVDPGVIATPDADGGSKASSDGGSSGCFIRSLFKG